MHRILALFVAVMLAAGLFAGCKGDSKDDAKTPGSTATSGKTAGASAGASTPASGSTAASGTPADGVTPAATSSSGGEATAAPGGSGGASVDETQAREFLDAVLLKPADLSGAWAIGADTIANNADAAQTDPVGAASFERCGRLLSRLITNMPEDAVTRYIGGETVTFFSTATVYKTSAGAADCAAEAAARFSQPGELAKLFGTVFIDPNAVSVKPIDFPPTGEGSAAFALTGQISAAGTIVDLTIVIVTFLQGNATVVVGSAAASTPSVDELKPLVTKVLERVKDKQ